VSDRIDRCCGRLVALRRREERAAQRAFARAAANVEAVRRQLRDLEGLLGEHAAAARRQIARGPAGASGSAYRQTVADLRAGMAARLAAFRLAADEMQRRQADLREAVAKRAAAEALLGKRTARRQERRRRMDERRVQETHTRGRLRPAGAAAT
jgi:flagellar export protein FliJ